MKLKWELSNGKYTVYYHTSDGRRVDVGSRETQGQAIKLLNRMSRLW